ncbi:MAG: M23 family metallopeptidase [Chloroflexi bacterium]|nr:M23 family metallopeptidase [Chloroflexota bacterium]
MRLIVPLLVAILLAACGGGKAAPTDTPSPTPSPTPTLSPSPTPSPTPTPSPSPTPSPTPARTPSPGAGIDLAGSHTKQGGFLAVRLRQAPEVAGDPAVVLAGVSYPMLREADVWYAYIGLPTWFTVGGYPMEVYAGGQVLVSGWLEVSAGGFAFESITLPPDSSDLLTDTARIEEERQRVASILAGFTPERYWSGAWITPAAGVVSDEFGTQRSINGGAYFPHTGLDIANDEGTPIYAAASGVVALAEELFLYGNAVILDHGAGVFSGYNHMTSLAVSAGDFVNQGDLIGYMGATGLVTGPHLHWEAVVHGVRVDPSLWTQGGVEP